MTSYDKERITYYSTREEKSSRSGKTFLEVALAGLPEDGGLYIPSHVPSISTSEQASWSRLNFRDLCFQVVRSFVCPDEISTTDLHRIIHNAYAGFNVPECLRLVQLPDCCAQGNVDESPTPQLYLMELFHGPSLAFKDFALQFLAQLFAHILEQPGSHDLTVVAATSGDTGSAAISSLHPVKRIRCVVLYPAGKVSRIQELQMTTVDAPHVYCLAVEGASFDDCQSYVKQLFNSPLKEKLHLTAMNSINWVRILAQMVYYWYTAFRIQEHHPGSTCDVCVPTGNFGNILAAYYAKKMGAPLGTLIIASNANDTLTRFYSTGIYRKAPTVTSTPSPSMDIQISSNFERLLYYLYKKDGSRVKQKFGIEFPERGEFSIDDTEAFKQLHEDFQAFKCSNEETAQAILTGYRRHTVPLGGEQRRLVMDPHTAVGYGAVMQYLQQEDPTTRSLARPIIIAATAHHAKFPEFVSSVLPNASSSDLEVPKRLQEVLSQPPRRRFTCQKGLDHVTRALCQYLDHTWGEDSRPVTP